MVTSIRAGVDRAVDSMGEVTAKVKTGVELSNEAGSALNEIVGSALRMCSRFWLTEDCAIFCSLVIIRNSMVQVADTTSCQ